MAELSITITIPDNEVPRMLKAFGRRFGNPDIAIEQMLQGLKQAAMAQIREAVMIEERAAIEEQKAAITPLNLS